VSEPALRQLLAIAVEVAREGGRRTHAHFNAGCSVELKPDGTPVTRADREAEAAMRARIARTFPDHAVLGEEEGESGGRAPYRWIIDPLDGTRTFVRGVPLFGTLVGIEAHDEPVVGVIHLPALDETIAAARGEGCTWNGRRCRVSAVGRLDDALLLVTDERAARTRSRAYERLAARTAMQRTWADCYGYALVATGRAEIALDPAMNVWDCAALLPVIEEAGGRFTDWRGRRTIRGGEAVATNGVLHEETLALLGES